MTLSVSVESDVHMEVDKTNGPLEELGNRRDSNASVSSRASQKSVSKKSRRPSNTSTGSANDIKVFARQGAPVGLMEP